MRIGVFTALLSKLPLVQVLEKLQSLDIHTVELGTGNYPGDPHCPLSHAHRSPGACAISSRNWKTAVFPSAR